MFVIGWDGAGNPFGIEGESGRVVVQDHNAAFGIYEVAPSFEALLLRHLDTLAARDQF